MLKVYVYQKCSTCRRALAFLDKNRVPHTVVAIRETPPTPAELESVLKRLGGNVRRIFNTSGDDYRRLGLKDQLDAMPQKDAIALLAANGNLVKRPFVISKSVGLAGFNEEEWQVLLVDGRA